jgi:hypothetical protein
MTGLCCTVLFYTWATPPATHTSLWLPGGAAPLLLAPLAAAAAASFLFFIHFQRVYDPVMSTPSTVKVPATTGTMTSMRTLLPPLLLAFLASGTGVGTRTGVATMTGLGVLVLLIVEASASAGTDHKQGGRGLQVLLEAEEA